MFLEKRRLSILHEKALKISIFKAFVWSNTTFKSRLVKPRLENRVTYLLYFINFFCKSSNDTPFVSGIISHT